MWAASKGEDIRFLPDSGFVAINSIMLTLSSSSNICVSRLNSEGDTLWNSYFGGADNDIGKAVIPISDGGFIIAGWVSSFGAGNYDCFVAKLDSLGNSSVEEKKTIPITNEIRCFPNPFNSSVRISIDAPVGAYCNTPLQIEIYDINGKKVFAESVGATHASPASTDKACLVPTEFVWSPAPSVPSGIYLIKAKMGMNIIRKKIIFLR